MISGIGESPEFDIYKDELYVRAVKILEMDRRLYSVNPKPSRSRWTEKYPFQASIWTKHPFFRTLTEADHLKIQSNAKRELESMRKKEMEEMARKTAVQNHINDRIRSNLSKLLDHHNYLMTELNRKIDEEDKVQYLQGQCLMLQKACVMKEVLMSFQERETELNNRLLNNNQMLVAVESSLADLNKIKKEKKSWSLHDVSAARPVIIAAAAAAAAALITALLKWRTRF